MIAELNGELAVHVDVESLEIDIAFEQAGARLLALSETVEQSILSPVRQREIRIDNNKKTSKHVCLCTFRCRLRCECAVVW